MPTDRGCCQKSLTIIVKLKHLILSYFIFEFVFTIIVHFSVMVLLISGLEKPSLKISYTRKTLLATLTIVFCTRKNFT